MWLLNQVPTIYHNGGRNLKEFACLQQPYRYHESL